MADRTDELPDEVDVLIVGVVPAGLVLAAQLAQFPEMTTRIIEQKPGPMELGQADGIACRTMEMFEAFGFAERVIAEAYWVNETAFWRPTPTRPARSRAAAGSRTPRTGCRSSRTSSSTRRGCTTSCSTRCATPRRGWRRTTPAA